MAQLLTFSRAMVSLLRRENDSIRRFVSGRMRLYKSQFRIAVETALSNTFQGSNTLSPTIYYSQEEVILDYIRKEMDSWWRQWIPYVENSGLNAYTDTRNLSIKAFERLGEIEYETVPDEKLPSPTGQDTIDLGTGDLIQKKEQEEETIPIIKLVVGTGGISSEYEKLLRAQFDEKIDPRNAIVTFGAQDVARIESSLIRGLRDGVDGAVIRDRLVKQLVDSSVSLAERKIIAGKIHTIIRTTMQNASIASAFMFARLNKMVIGLVRHTGPRPCVACIALAGTVYQKYNDFRDHVRGMCFVTFEIIPPEKLGIDMSKLPERYRQNWRRDLGEIPLRKLQFHSLPQDEQRTIFANDALFYFWKQEKFPLEAIAVKRGGAYTQASYNDLISRVSTLGGISHPKISFPSDAIKNKWNDILDPNDRANARLRFLINPPLVVTLNSYGLSIYPPNITPDMLKDVDPSLKSYISRVPIKLEDIEDAPWHLYNAVARILSINIRKATNGSIYYVEG